ncbi:gluconolactonase [miscellaneous Crenarchaeota group-15 archaeon DG-45]|uniref:Gluconolactonase n=1 Tax=miscellaneous Crenarchaeota group-15 archaeon DG-45 TaxID=1685127 RepID=A0A0M0BS77_9ARCH|nr:MAG: gluconolactonase [miscellaneous Crenarchaeota group-15 archaeon DG-45]
MNRKSGSPPIVPEGSEPERLATGFQFTEGPVWNASGGFLLFSDIPANRICRWSRGDGATVFREPSGSSNGLTYDGDGSLMICEHGNRRLSKVDTSGAYAVLADRFRGRRLNSPNDVVVRSDRLIYFTDPPYGIEPGEQELEFQGVFMLEPESGDLTLLVDDFDRPNGLALSPDETALYVADSSGRRHVRVFDVGRDGALSGGRVFAEIRSDLPGNPDGMKVDTEGNLYVAAAGVWVFSEEGEHLGTIGIPERPANLAWGGERWRSLFITARTSIYRIELDIAGVRVP